MKLTKIELKKYFKNPITYIVSALLVLVMLVSIMIYKPTLKINTTIKNMYSNMKIDTQNYNDVYNFFFNDIATLSKNTFDNKIEASKNYLDNHNPNVESNDVYKKLNNIVVQIENNIINENPYIACINIKNLLPQFKTILTTSTDNRDETFTAVATKDAKNGLISLIDTSIAILNDGTPEPAQIEQLNEKNLVNNLKNLLNGVKSFIPTSSEFNVANNYYNKGVKLVESINLKLSTLPLIDGDVNELLNIIEEYSRITDYCFYIVTNQIKVSAIYAIGEEEAKNYIGLKDINTYEYKESVTKYKYLLDYFETEKTYLDYVEPINIAYTHINNVNIADYVGFVCTLCTFVIIAYICIAGAISVNSEFNSGTMRMIATKPFKKNKIITSKIWATILYGLILLISTFIVAVIMGGVAYGFSTPPVMLIINASTAICCSVYIELLLFLLTLIIQVVLFASLSILISTIIKNNIIASLVSCILYFVSIVFNIVNINISFLPFTNINLWKYFGGSFLLNNNKNFFALLFTSKPVATNTIIINIVSFIVIIIVAQIVTHIVFRKKEIK